jgi:hypothetical protein
LVGGQIFSAKVVPAVRAAARRVERCMLVRMEMLGVKLCVVLMGKRQTGRFVCSNVKSARVLYKQTPQIYI